MIFAQSGFGKTNLVKVLLYHMAGDNSYGKLIFDLNGEYFLRGTSTYGLVILTKTISGKMWWLF